MMGSEFGQWNEWHFEHSLDWHLLEQNQENRAIQAFFQAANAFYLSNKPLWDLDFSWEGFQWLQADDNQANTVAFLRKDEKGDTLVVLCNFSPIHRTGYTIGVPFRGTYREVFNTDRTEFGGLGRLNESDLLSQDQPCQGQDQQLSVDIPPMGAVILKCVKKKPPLKPKAPAKKASSTKKV